MLKYSTKILSTNTPSTKILSANTPSTSTSHKHTPSTKDSLHKETHRLAPESPKALISAAFESEYSAASLHCETSTAYSLQYTKNNAYCSSTPRAVDLVYQYI
jgi:hypothetical protein